MKKIYIILIAAIFFGCDKFIDEVPKGTLIPESVDDMGMILDGFDDPNQITYGHANQTLMTDDSRLTDAAAALVSNTGSNTYIWAEHIYTSSEDDRDWNGFYHVIYLCNYILEKIDDAPEGTGTFSRDVVKGSALLNRANSFLTLVNIYARHFDESTASTDLGVPLPLESDINKQYARATIAEVYEQVLADLNAAAELLPATSEYTFQGTKQAALGLLSRVYLYQGNYTKAEEKAEDVLAIVSALTDYNTISPYLPGQPDFGLLNWPLTNGWEKPDVIFFKWNKDHTTQYYISDELLNLLDQTTDLRFRNFVTNYAYLSFSVDAVNGYRLSGNADVNRGISLGEVYLINAEAKVRIGTDIGGALEALNALRAKRFLAGTPEITETNPDALLQIVLDERRRETMFKGLRWFDLKRLNKDSQTAKTITHTLFGQTYTLEPGSNRYVLPIPRKAIAVNSLIEQNPR